MIKIWNPDDIIMHWSKIYTHWRCHRRQNSHFEVLFPFPLNSQWQSPVLSGCHSIHFLIVPFSFPEPQLPPWPFSRFAKVARKRKKRRNQFRGFETYVLKGFLFLLEPLVGVHEFLLGLIEVVLELLHLLLKIADLLLSLEKLVGNIKIRFLTHDINLVFSDKSPQYFKIG